MNQGFARIGLALKAERVRHRRDDMLLVRIDASEVRFIDEPGGRTNSVLLDQRRLAFLPVEIDCGNMTLSVGGKVYRPSRVSPCSGVTRIGHPQAMPVFVAFDYPNPGAGRITVPVEVQEPDAPVQTRIRPGPSYAARVVEKHLLGRRELIAGIVFPGGKPASR